MTKTRTPRKNLIVALSLFLVAVALTACGKKGQEDYEKGKALYTGQDYKTAVTHFALAADKGHDEAQCMIGKCYQEGKGVQKDTKEAVKWFQQAAAQGNAEAMFCMGKCFTYGMGVSRSPEAAAEWYRKAAEKGHAEAQYEIGACYMRQVGVKKDGSEGEKWWLKSAKQGNKDAMYELALLYHKGFEDPEIPQDDEKAEKWAQAAMKEGMTIAKDILESISTAKQTLKSAEDGNVTAQYKMGLYYKSEAHSPRKSVKWFAKAAEKGHLASQLELANLYISGDGVDMDISEAIKWYGKAAEQGNAEARKHCEELKGIEKEFKAAQKGDPEAQFNLGVSYYTGEGIGKNNEEAFKWTLKAAKQDVPEAQFNLGYFYFFGVGVDRNAAEAEEWLKKAEAKGACEDAKGTLAEWERQERSRQELIRGMDDLLNNMFDFNN